MGALTKPEQVAEAMARIESEAVRMSGLVENLLTLARQDESTAIEKSQIDILAIARNVAKDIAVANSHKNPITICDLSGIEYSDQQQLVVPANANGMQQVLTNLISNAARFSDAGQPIEIAAGFESHSKNSKCIIEVRDHGEGIPEALRQKVFERFYRVDNSRNSETGGSGLGLAIASSIVHRHGGDIKAVETEGGGATFRMHLPGH
jgi:two-component system OmpR family sensor kinase